MYNSVTISFYGRGNAPRKLNFQTEGDAIGYQYHVKDRFESLDSPHKCIKGIERFDESGNLREGLYFPNPKTGLISSDRVKTFR